MYLIIPVKIVGIEGNLGMSSVCNVQKRTIKAKTLNVPPYRILKTLC
jgi:hypothetical protein